MRFAGIICCSVVAAGLAAGQAQNTDIFTRLRRALAPQGSGDLAATELARKNFTRVEEILSTAKASDRSEHAELLALRGAVFFLAGQTNLAVDEFNQAERMAPLQDGDRFTLAMALVKLGDTKRASEALADLSKRYPSRAIYIYWLGRIDYDQRRYDEAAAKFNKAIELDPVASRSWDSLGLTYDMQGRLGPALASFEKAAVLNRRQQQPSPWPPHNLGYLLLRMDREREAEESLRESLRYDPGLAPSHYHLARTLEKEGREEEAVAEYLRALATDGTATDACYSLAMLYRRLHRTEDAERMFGEYRRRRDAGGTASGGIAEKR